MYKKALFIPLILLFVLLAVIKIYANDDLTFDFELSVDGKYTKEVQKGDIITVTLRLHRTDSLEKYMIYALQDEIQYDGEFLEYMEDSSVANSGIVIKDIGLVDNHREVYINYLSMSGGKLWENNTLVGNIQFKVIGDSGVSQITNQDYLVSLPDGSGSYPCDHKDITVILSTECKINLFTNDGDELSNFVIQYGEKITKPEDPVREGYIFEGWYTDINLTNKWDFENDIVQGNLSLYAKWTAVDINSDDFNNLELSVNCILVWTLLLVVAVLLILLCYKKKDLLFTIKK